MLDIIWLDIIRTREHIESYSIYLEAYWKNEFSKEQRRKTLNSLNVSGVQLQSIVDMAKTVMSE